MNFLGSGIFAIVVGFSLGALITGKLPLIGGSPSNYVVFGDKNINPRLLTGTRARIVSFVFASIFCFFIAIIFEKSVYNFVSIILGLAVGLVVRELFLKRV